VLNSILQFLYTIAQALGKAIVAGIQRVLPQAQIPNDLVDPIGFMAALTLFAILAGVARRIAWIVVSVGWVFIVVRIVLILVGG
jgi:uncharacterized membrane protein